MARLEKIILSGNFVVFTYRPSIQGGYGLPVIHGFDISDAICIVFKLELENNSCSFYRINKNCDKLLKLSFEKEKFFEQIKGIRDELDQRFSHSGKHDSNLPEEFCWAWIVKNTIEQFEETKENIFLKFKNGNTRYEIHPRCWQQIKSDYLKDVSNAISNPTGSLDKQEDH